MALISPGVQVTVIDESQYQPTAQGTIAYVLLATAQDKTNPNGDIATYTTQANAEKLFAVSSQRELVQRFGTPTFQVDASDNPINGDERNEYGLLAAYSALGVANRVYVQRANVDLAQLEGTSIRPTGNATDGTYWLDISADGTNWGVYEWGEDGLVLQSPDVITNTAYLSSGVPIGSYGAIGSYAVVATSVNNPVYYKGYENAWVLVGSQDWEDVVYTIRGSIANPANLSISDKLVLNGTNISLTSTTISSAVTDINTAMTGKGVSARVNGTGQLELFVNRTAASSGNLSLADGKLTIGKGTTIGGADCAIKLGLFDSTIDGTANTKTLFGPTITYASYRDAPAWRVTDATPRPWGSIWFKTSATGNGANYGIKEYDAVLDSWVKQAAPLYETDADAVYGLDPVGGGISLAAGTIYVKYDTQANSTGTFRLYRKAVTGLTKATGTVAGGSATYTIGHSFRMESNIPGTDTPNITTISLSGTTAASLVADILAADIPNVVAAIESSGAISISHLAGGTIKFTYLSGTPLTQAGIIADNNVQTITGGSVYLLSPFRALTYTYSETAPYSNPSDGTLWYYNNPLDVDILVHDGSGWRGYQNGGTDARGFDLSATDSAGPILSATEPLEQSDGAQLASGDLWIDTGDLENYPVIRRYNGTTWELIDNTDQVSVDGIVFADARWDNDGTSDPIVDDLVDITDLLSSDYIDDDCPDYRLYARGTLLFNTRRSGYNVKRFESEWHINAATVPTEIGSWVSSSGQNLDGVPYFGHKAQRNVIVEALKSAIESSTALREEQVQFNLIACPGYPEVIQNMITLNNDRKNTAFIIGDSPLTLDSSTASIQEWASNSNLAADNGETGLVSRSEYLAVYYPSGYATNLDGESVVVPASHAMLRTYIRSDNVSYPWFAPAGVRRGLIDNVSSIGYVDITDDNLFRSIGVTVGLRDTLYDNDVNPLTVLPGVGLVAYGQKTRAATNSAMDRVNVARLIVYLRTVLDSVARPFIFEPNDTLTRNQVKQAFESVLNDVVAKRGIYDYLVVCDETNNTPDRIDRNELYVDIAIEPVKAIEFIYIPVRLKNTGAIAAGL
jgi:hypothetical protein